MKAIRVLAVGALVLLFLYFVLRAAASSCAGAGCDVYLPLSLVLPLLIVVILALSGVLSMSRARGHAAWFTVLLVSTVFGISGPVIGLLVFRDNPDIFVPVATAFELLAALTTLSYSFVAAGSGSSPITKQDVR